MRKKDRILFFTRRTKEERRYEILITNTKYLRSPYKKSPTVLISNLIMTRKLQYIKGATLYSDQATAVRYNYAYIL